MALVKFQNGILSGKVGGTVYTSNRGGQVARTWRKPTNHRTVRQTQARANLGNASQGFKAMTVAQRTAWSLWAQVNPILNRMGASIVLSGISAYNALACRTLDRGGSPVALPPTGTGPLAPLSASGAIVGSTGVATVTFTPTPLAAGYRIALWSCSPGPASQDKGLKAARLVGYATVATTSPATFTLPFRCATNDVINLWVAVLADDGRQSPFLKLRVTAT